MKKKLLSVLLAAACMTSVFTTPVAAAQSADTNDTKETADALTFGVAISDELGSYQRYENHNDTLDEDWFSFPMTAGVTYRVTVEDWNGTFKDTTALLDVYENGDESRFWDSLGFDMEDDGVNYADYTAKNSGTCYLQMSNYFDINDKTAKHYYSIMVTVVGAGETKFASYQGCTFTTDENGDVRCYDAAGKLVHDTFKCDGTYTYYLQTNGVAMKNRLTYHPDGVHVIYFDENGHEVFSDFHHVSTSISNEAVDDECFFDVNGYMYVDVLTYDKTGTYLLYANPYGRLECAGWFQFSNTVKWADGTACTGIAGGYGYGQSDCHLLTNTQTSDWQGRACYLQGNGVALY